MKKRTTRIILVLLLTVSPWGVSPAQAETGQPEALTALGLMGTKLARGVANLGTGWLEVPKQIYHVAREEGVLIGLARGPIDGLGMFAARTVAGAYEILTFPVPLPFRYQPMLQPEYVWQVDPPEAHAASFEPASAVTP